MPTQQLEVATISPALVMQACEGVLLCLIMPLGLVVVPPV